MREGSTWQHAGAIPLLAGGAVHSQLSPGCTQLPSLKVTIGADHGPTDFLATPAKQLQQSCIEKTLKLTQERHAHAKQQEQCKTARAETITCSRCFSFLDFPSLSTQCLVAGPWPLRRCIFLLSSSVSHPSPSSLSDLCTCASMISMQVANATTHWHTQSKQCKNAKATAPTGATASTFSHTWNIARTTVKKADTEIA